MAKQTTVRLPDGLADSALHAPRAGFGDTDDAVEAMLAVAASEVDETWLAHWLRDRVSFPT